MYVVSPDGVPPICSMERDQQCFQKNEALSSAELAMNLMGFRCFQGFESREPRSWQDRKNPPENCRLLSPNERQKHDRSEMINDAVAVFESSEGENSLFDPSSEKSYFRAALVQGAPGL